MVKTHINNNQLYRKLIDEKIKYIGMHVRLSDKTNGTLKETEYIDLHKYLDRCLELCNEHSINVIVICSDTIDGLNNILDYNKSLNNNITIIYNRVRECMNNITKYIIWNFNNRIIYIIIILNNKKNE